MENKISEKVLENEVQAGNHFILKEVEGELVLEQKKQT